MGSKRKPSRYITCESMACIVVHIRKMDPGSEPNYGGHPQQNGPQSICGRSMAWDTKIPVDGATCQTCRLMYRVNLRAGAQ